jgi:hypothetical protein
MISVIIGVIAGVIVFALDKKVLRLSARVGIKNNWMIPIGSMAFLATVCRLLYYIIFE